MKITVKTSKGDLYSVELPSDASTVAEIKEQLQATQNIAVESQMLILRGKFLENPRPLKDYALKDGSTIRLVVQKKEKKSPPAAATGEVKKEIKGEVKEEIKEELQVQDEAASAQPGSGLGMGNGFNLSQLGQIGNGSLMEQMRSSFMNNPKARKDLVNRMKEMANNPEQLHAALSMSLDFQGVPEPEKKRMLESMKSSFVVLRENPEYFEKFLSEMASDPSLMNGLGGMGGYPRNVQPMESIESAMSKPMTHPMPLDKEEEMGRKYVRQLGELESMGYTDKELNLMALVYANGDLNKAVNLLMDWLEES